LKTRFTNTNTAPGIAGIASSGVTGLLDFGLMGVIVKHTTITKSAAYSSEECGAFMRTAVALL
jgi:hypothetical protein